VRRNPGPLPGHFVSIGQNATPALLATTKSPCHLPQGVPGPAKECVRLPLACPAPCRSSTTRPGLVCACHHVFAFARKAATCRCCIDRCSRAAASWLTSRYSPGMLLPGGAYTKSVWGVGTKFTWRIDLGGLQTSIFSVRVVSSQVRPCPRHPTGL
jgi:hypothetical protein